MTRRRLKIPEIIQTSGMDCGPAVLSAVLNGYHIPASYNRLREACQTDLDGTSIDILEETLQQFHLDADQVMLPADHLFLETSPTVPAIFVVRRPSGLTHFVVAWRRVGLNSLEVMDPATGRHTMPIDQFKKNLYIHRFPVPAAAWRDFAGSPDFIDPLRERLARMGIKRQAIHLLIERARRDPSWQALATLDAAVRFAQSLIDTGAAAAVDSVFLDKLIDGSRPKSRGEPLIPWSTWSVEPIEPDADEEPHLLLKGAVLITLPDQPAARVDPTPPSDDVRRLLAERPVQPEALLWRFLRADGLLDPLLLGGLLFISALITVVEALFWRGILELGRWNIAIEQQTLFFGGFLLLLLLNLLVKKEKTGVSLKLARQLELRLRLAILERLPHIQSRYFGTRPVSDMAERNHSLFRLRELPLRGSRLIELVFLIILSTAALAIMIPALAWLAILNAVLAIAFPIWAQSTLHEKDLQVRTHVGALAQFYLDALRGIVPARAHAAEQSLLREQEHLLVSWASARWHLVRTTVSLEAIQQVAGTGMAIGYIWLHIRLGLPLPPLLLAAYWLLNVFDYGQELAFLARLYPTLRNHLLRASELIDQPAGPAGTRSPAAAHPDQFSGQTEGVNIDVRAASIKIGGQIALADINVLIPAGEHVAIVGPSGAGKSTFIGSLLGWQMAHTGCIYIDDRPLREHNIAALRAVTVWIDPAVQLWNRTLWENLTYGHSNGSSIQPSELLSQAELIDFLERLPDGWRSPLGEDGRLVSGGEGQRVRYGRAICRENPRLVLLDEPFRGLDRPQRTRLLKRARQKWSDATLLCVTHDLAEAETFDRVLFFHSGRLVQEGKPAELKRIKEGPFAQFLRQHQALASAVWGADRWRQWQIIDGHLFEERGNRD